MVGGVVIEVLAQPGKIWVNVQDQQSSETCALNVADTEVARKIAVGDQVWWQGRSVMWTPAANRLPEDSPAVCALRCGVDYDVQIPRIGYSGAPHPGQALIDKAFPPGVV